MRGLVRILALAGFAYAMWELIKRAQAAETPAWEAPPQAAQTGHAEAKRSAPAPAQAAAASGSPSDGAATKAELYERAAELGIKGRSKMSKAELERAIREAG